MTETPSTDATQPAPDAAPVSANPNPPAPAEPAPVHPTGLYLSPDEIQGPTGAVTEEPDLEADPSPDDPSAEPEYELGEQFEPKDVENGGAA